MLSITRKNGQSFYVGDDIVITVKRATKGSAVISIKAPDDILIMRTELMDGSFTDIPVPDVVFEPFHKER
ncbi:carbon storage regulator [Zhongshania borealis]|uniref:Translational regulator CsrA n=1 Tax=Zhongshania borealis TaxID=889488 RepID=A0ABP7WLK3_9GAMM